MRALCDYSLFLPSVFIRLLPWASVGFRSGAISVCRGENPKFTTVSPVNMRSLGSPTVFYTPSASVGFRGLPWAPGVSIYVGAVCTETRSSDAVFLGDIRILDALILFLLHCIFRGLPRASVVSIFVCASGMATRSPNAVFPGNKRTQWALILFPPVSFRGLHCASVGFRGLPLCPYMAGSLVREPEVQTMYFPEIFGF